MKYLTLLCIIGLVFSNSLFSQDLEVQGKARITQMEKVNTADSVVVVLADGTLARRDVSSLSEFQILTISNDSIFLANGGFVVLPLDKVDDADANPANELQTIGRSGTTVTLSQGGGSYQDSVLSESQVDAYAGNNGYLTTELDGDPANELQTIGRSGTTVTLSQGGGSYQDSVLSESQVDAYAGNNGYLTTELDGDPANELQTIGRLGTTVTLSQGGGSYQDSVLSESQVDAYAGNNGYLTTELDGDPANELQTIGRLGTTVTLSQGGGSYQDSVLSESQVDAYAGNNGYLTTELDGDPANELQTLSIIADTIFLTGSNQIVLPLDQNAGWNMNIDTTSTVKYVGIGITKPNYRLDVNGYSASTNQVSIIPLWQAGSNFTMSNTSGSDLSNCESGIIPTVYNANGNIEVQLVVRITSTSAGTNNFQLRSHDGTTQAFPISESGWTFASTQSGIVATSGWRDWAAGTNVHEIHLQGWVDAGSTNFNSVYLMVRPNR